MKNIRDLIAERGHVLNTYCQMPGAFVAEAWSRLGWDAVTLDLQHGMIEPQDAIAMFQSMHASGVIPMVRVPWCDPVMIMKMLDAGALGITCAMINTAAQAEELVRHAKYPPRGERSLGPLRAEMIYGPTYPREANRLVNLFAMIETREGVDNAEAIAAVDGIDGVYIGPGDLALSMGRPIMFGPLDPEVAEAVEHIKAACLKRGLAVGMIANDAERAWQLIQSGVRFVTMASEMRAMLGQGQAWVKRFRELSATPEPARAVGL